MTSIAILVTGAGLLFGAFVLLLVGLGAVDTNAKDAGVRRSLALINAAGSSAPARPTPSASFRDLPHRIAEATSSRLRATGARLTPVARRASLRRKLEMAGSPRGWDVDRVLALKVAGLLAGSIVGLLLPLLLGAFAATFVIAPAFALAGFFAADLGLYQAAYNRNEQIRRELPDALDLLTVSVESGLGFDAAMRQVAHKTVGPLADEFSRVLQEIQIGTGRASALRGLAERTNVEELQRFIAAMVQADGLGISISAVLRVQSSEMRVKRSQRAEEAAQKVPVKILFPLIFCIMPALFTVVMGPAVLSIIDSIVGI